jgi:DNA polymerase-1
MGIGFEKNKVFVIPREMRHRVKDFFALDNLRWTWQHGKYDTKVIWRRKLGTVPLHNDVMYAHYTLDETSAHDLEHLSKTFLQAEAYKYKMNQNFKAITLENYPQWFDALCERVAVDCDYTFQLEDVLLAELEKEPSLLKLYQKIIMPAAPFLSRVEQNGILLDPELLEGYDKDYVVRLEIIMHEIEQIAAPYWDPEIYKEEMGAKSAPAVFNPGSPKQMSWMVFKKLKLKPRIRKGASTNADVLDSIEGGHPLVDKVLEYRSVKKEYTTYVLGLLKWRDIDGRVRTNFNLQVTATGRLSSKEPNVQNLPNAFGVGNIRRAIIPPKQFLIMDSDYSGAELRWLACLSKCPVLLDTFRNKINIHNRTAKKLYGANYTSQHKMRAKAVNFGIPYGREAQSFVDEFQISRAEADAMIEGWLNEYHGARDYLLWCAAAVTKGYYLETPFGRRRRFGLVTEDALHALQNEARNFPIQSASSDTTLVAGMELEPIAQKFGAQTINLVHDSILYYVPAEKDLVLEFGYKVNQHMIHVPERLFGYDVPFESDTDIGFTWDKEDLVNLRFDTEQVMWEEKVNGEKTEIFMDFGKWLDRAKEQHSYKYERGWYMGLQTI